MQDGIVSIVSRMDDKKDSMKRTLLSVKEIAQELGARPRAARPPAIAGGAQDDQPPASKTGALFLGNRS